MITRFLLRSILLTLASLLITPVAGAQQFGSFDRFDPIGAPAADPGQGDPLNPIAMLENSADAIPGFEGGLSGAINIMVLLTVLSLVPAIMIMCTCFIRFIIVLCS